MTKTQLLSDLLSRLIGLSLNGSIQWKETADPNQRLCAIDGYRSATISRLDRPDEEMDDYVLRWSRSLIHLPTATLERWSAISDSHTHSQFRRLWELATRGDLERGLREAIADLKALHGEPEEEGE